MIYLVISAFLFLLPYFFSKLYGLLFFSLVPLFYRSYYRSYRFWYGFVWGIVVFSVHTIWFLQSILLHGVGCKSFLFWTLIVAWFSLFAGGWFLVQSYIQKNLKSDFGFMVSWTVATVLFFYCIIENSLFCCGVCEGYVFFNPTIILAQCPPMIWGIKYVKSYGMIAGLCLAQVAMITTVVRSWWYIFVLFVAMMPFVSGFIFYRPKQLPPLPICFVKPWWHASKDPIFVGYRMVHDVTLLQHERPDITSIVMPESSFGWNIYNYLQFITMMSDYCAQTKILFGGQRTVDALSRGSFFVVQNGEMVFTYDKVHLMPFVERFCYLFGLSLFQQSLQQHDFFVYGDNDQDDVIEIEQIKVQLFICSELLFEAKSIKGFPILFVCNDTWLCCDYAKRWVSLFVNYCSIKYDVPIVWASVSGQTNIEQFRF